MRQAHPAGDKVFVDYSGKKIMIVDRQTGVVRDAEIFVAVLGGLELHLRRSELDVDTSGLDRAPCPDFRFFGEVPRLVVPDNLKSGVHRASFYDPEINRSYGMMASHYGVGILRTRPRKPRDKAKVEAGVRFAQTYILGRLRRQTFFSLAEANAAITAALERINAHVMRRIGVSRRQLFETVERPVLAPLPDADYQFAEWLFKDIDRERSELIAARAVAARALTYKSIASIYANKLERSSRDTEDAIIEHPNLRGPGYFH
ncbi:hypothetical protein [Bradyrhizobium diversitatis]|uniref:hypothetical protein n=1 Tax=Bradyrhizobium diversitatis TaxID=2755406 RepID=UPI001FE546BC|nr:hypothetical protein [Bradyrhizobium diversitatis]